MDITLSPCVWVFVNYQLVLTSLVSYISIHTIAEFINICEYAQLHTDATMNNLLFLLSRDGYGIAMDVSVNFTNT